MRALSFAVLLGTVFAVATLSVSAQDPMDHVDLTSEEMSGAEMTRAELLAMLADVSSDTPLDLTKRRLSGLDLSGVDFKGANLRWARLNATNLSNANLSGTLLDSAWLIGANLSGADLTGANLASTQLQRADLSGANLNKSRIVANFQRANLQGATFLQADLSADMKNQSMGLMRTVFRSANLQGVDFSGANLNHMDAEFAALTDVVFDGATAQHSKLGGANMLGASVAGFDITEADIDSTRMKGLKNLDQLIGLDAAKNRKKAFFK